jgi:hypothetical protein
MEFVKLAVSLLLGGSGYAILHQFFVRSRVYRAMRDYRTVRIFNEQERPRIEAALRSQGIPTAYAEVEWWNRGHRAAENITLELRTPGPIIAWQMIPACDDLAAGWSCTHDPGSSGNDLRMIRLVQPRLMPRTSCSLVVGYNSDDDTAASTLRAYQATREIPSTTTLAKLHSSASGFITLAIAFGLLALAKLFVRARLGEGSSIGGWIMFAAFFGGLFAAMRLAPRLLSPLHPGTPSWEVKAQGE